VGLLRVAVIKLKLVPETAPVTPPVAIGVDQEYVELAGIFPLAADGETVNAIPWQVTAVIALTTGVGNKVTVTVNGVPSPQLLGAVGVTR
jgi:hypothetical protein